MLIKKFTQFILKSRKNAIFIALLCAVLPLLGWVCAVIVALVTLCKGPLEGFLVLLWASLPYVVLLYKGAWFSLIYAVVFGTLFIWILSITLRRFVSWVLTIEVAVVFAVLAILIVHGYANNIDAWWVSFIMGNVNKVTEATSLSFNMPLVKQTLQVMAPYMTGLQAAFVVLGVILELMIARSLQSRIFDPGQWQKEWLQLRSSYFMVMALALCLVLAAFGLSLFKDIVPVLVLPLLISGASLFHSCMVTLKVPVGFVVLFYLLVIIVFTLYPLLLSILVIAAMLDSFVDFRKRLITSKC
jgi:hypothetical protein